VVFVEDAGVLNRHLPPAEVDELRPEGAVYGIERCGAERAAYGHESSG
jgi:hypothetical protein